METFELTGENGITRTFIGDYANAWQNYWDDEMAKNNQSFMEYCVETCEQVKEPDSILTEEYLTSLGWRMVEQCNDNYFYSRDVNDRQEELRYSVVHDGGVLATITHVSGGYYSAGVFSGKIDSRQTFEIILNAVS